MEHSYLVADMLSEAASLLERAADNRRASAEGERGLYSALERRVLGWLGAIERVARVLEIRVAEELCARGAGQIRPEASSAGDDDHSGLIRELTECVQGLAPEDGVPVSAPGDYLLGVLALVVQAASLPGGVDARVALRATASVRHGVVGALADAVDAGSAAQGLADWIRGSLGDHGGALAVAELLEAVDGQEERGALDALFAEAAGEEQLPLGWDWGLRDFNSLEDDAARLYRGAVLRDAGLRLDDLRLRETVHDAGWSTKERWGELLVQLEEARTGTVFEELLCADELTQAWGALCQQGWERVSTPACAAWGLWQRMLRVFPKLPDEDAGDREASAYQRCPREAAARSLLQHPMTILADEELQPGTLRDYFGRLDAWAELASKALQSVERAASRYSMPGWHSSLQGYFAEFQQSILAVNQARRRRSSPSSQGASQQGRLRSQNCRPWPFTPTEWDDPSRQDDRHAASAHLGIDRKQLLRLVAEEWRDARPAFARAEERFVLALESMERLMWHDAAEAVLGEIDRASDFNVLLQLPDGRWKIRCRTLRGDHLDVSLEPGEVGLRGLELWGRLAGGGSVPPRDGSALSKGRRALAEKWSEGAVLEELLCHKTIRDEIRLVVPQGELPWVGRIDQAPLFTLLSGSSA